MIMPTMTITSKSVLFKKLIRTLENINVPIQIKINTIPMPLVNGPANNRMNF